MLKLPLQTTSEQYFHPLPIAQFKVAYVLDMQYKQYKVLRIVYLSSDPGTFHNTNDITVQEYATFSHKAATLTTGQSDTAVLPQVLPLSLLSLVHPTIRSFFLYFFA